MYMTTVRPALAAAAPPAPGMPLQLQLHLQACSQLPAPSWELPAPSSQLGAPSSQLPAGSSQLPAQHIAETFQNSALPSSSHVVRMTHLNRGANDADDLGFVLQQA